MEKFKSLQVRRRRSSEKRLEVMDKTNQSFKQLTESPQSQISSEEQEKIPIMASEETSNVATISQFRAVEMPLAPTEENLKVIQEEADQEVVLTGLKAFFSEALERGLVRQKQQNAREKRYALKIHYDEVLQDQLEKRLAELENRVPTDDELTDLLTNFIGANLNNRQFKHMSPMKEYEDNKRKIK